MTLIEVAEARHLGIRLIEQPQDRSSGSTAPGTPVVLVLEPEETLAGLLEVALSYAGFTVEIASDYARALEAFDRRRPTLMILDVEAPGNAGMTLLQTLRARSDVPIILLTAPGATEDRVAGLNIGADDCLTKPFRFDELTARMQSVLRRHRITLAKTLVESRFDAKALIRAIAGSATYQRTSRPNATNADDEQNDSRARLRRLDAEVLFTMRDLASNLSDAEKRARAHFVVDSSRSFDSARAQVHGILRAIAALPGRRIG